MLPNIRVTGQMQVKAKEIAIFRRDFGHNIDTKAFPFSKLTPIEEMIIQRRLT